MTLHAEKKAFCFNLQLTTCVFIHTNHQTYHPQHHHLIALKLDRCYDHEFVIATPIAYDHGCVLIELTNENAAVIVGNRRPRPLPTFIYDHKFTSWCCDSQT